MGIVLSLIFGAVWWVFFKQNTHFDMSIGVMLIGLAGLIIGGLIGLISGISNVFRQRQLNDLFIYFWIWLGASPPPEYKVTRAELRVELGIGRFILQICFWISFWAVAGAVLGAIGGLFFGLFGFGARSLEEAIDSMLWASSAWATLGPMMGIFLGSMMWFASQVMMRVKFAGRYVKMTSEIAEMPFWLVGGKLGEKIFNKLFGE